ncbi:MAG TPA: Gfo/Idh/MocA family oxidoreductase [Chitinophagaceae bacterium]|nr:Gfo/Idh/MocA family oxidoreductase [Chitinophagaceae bacterium]
MQPINTALCSFGMSGWVFHAPFIATDPHFKLYAVWERTKNLAKQKYPGVKTCRTLEEILADYAIELVVVNTPNVTHFDYTKKALLAGKHVVVEKPFTATVEEANELIKLAQKQNKKLSVYQNRRYDSDYRTIKKVLEEKLLGDVVEAEFHFDRYSEVLSPKQHKEIPVHGTGTLYDLGAHLIDQALQLFGMPGALFADIRIVRPISKVDDYFDLLLYYSQLRVRIKSSYLVREPLPGYILHGSKGSFIKAKTNIQEEALQAGTVPGSANWGTEPEKERGLLHTEKDGKIIREYIQSETGNYADYYNGIYETIRNDKPVPVSGEDALKVIKIIETAFKSSNEKRVVEVA